MSSKTLRGLEEWRLKKVGIELRDLSSTIFDCMYCERGWSPNLLPGGRMPKRWWKCPNGCNENMKFPY